MTKREADRLKQLIPGGVPKWVRVYDNGGPGIFLRRRPGTEGPKEGTLDRYTVVFTGRYRHKTARQSIYLAMNGAPFHPQGFCQHGEHHTPIDTPSYGHLGKKIRFADLPPDCQLAVIQDYLYIWDLPGVDEAGELLNGWQEIVGRT
jgi:hypothetical protein